MVTGRNRLKIIKNCLKFWYRGDRNWKLMDGHLSAAFVLKISEFFRVFTRMTKLCLISSIPMLILMVFKFFTIIALFQYY